MQAAKAQQQAVEFYLGVAAARRLGLRGVGGRGGRQAGQQGGRAGAGRGSSWLGALPTRSREDACSRDSGIRRARSLQVAACQSCSP